MNLTADLERYARAIAGRLIRVDGPSKDSRGILYRCGDRKFRNYDAAVRHRERHNRRIATEGRLAASAPDLLRAARMVIRRWDRGDLAAAVRDLAAVIVFVDGQHPKENTA